MFIITAALLLAGCGASPQRQVVNGDLLWEDDFSTIGAWQNRSTSEAVVGVDTTAGVYRMRSSLRQYVRGFNTMQRHEALVIEVNARQLTGEPTNAYGVVCRASLNSDSASGYYFMIGGDGSVSIRKGRAGDLDALVAWERTDAVNRGIARNALRIVCADDYLALYVNGELVAQATDSAYQGGYLGFVLATREGSTSEVDFSDLRVWAAVLAPE